MNKVCHHCQARFDVTASDLEFYDRVSPVFAGKKYAIPPQTLCPFCRRQRRQSWRNERNLHRNICAFSGKQVLSIYRSDAPYKVYAHDLWYSDKWDALEYGRTFDFKKSFFEQFDALNRDIPQLNLNHQMPSINCEYTNLVTGNKNCYLVFATGFSEDCYYCNYMHRCKDVLDSFFIFDCERCYECIDCQSCSRLTHTQYSENCHDSSYLDNCKNCTESFGCVSLVSKKHHFFNQPLDPKEYQKRVSELEANPSFLQKFHGMIEELRSTMPRKYIAGTNNENVTGDHLIGCRNVFDSFDCKDSEDLKFCTWITQGKDCMDCYAWGITGELGYENHLCGNGFYNVRFSDSCWNSVRDLLYCRYCIGCKNCFGCIGLQRKEFCVFNKQYTEKEYEELVPKIIKHMEKAGEWGEFFPTKYSPFPYNDTLAQDYYPLSKAEILERGWKQGESDVPSGRQTIDWSKIPVSIQDVPDSITEEILLCTGCERNFRIIPQELKFYREMSFPLPKCCFDCRYRRRLALRNPRKLWTRKCEKCKKELQSTYAPERPEKIYCEECYLKEVY